MSNYQRYQPRRRTYRSTSRRWNVIGWGVAIIVVVVLIWNGLFGGSGDSKKNEENRNAEITLAGSNANTNGNTSSSTPEIAGRELTARDCSRAISTAAVDQPYVALTLNAGGIVGDAKQLVDVLKQNNIPATLFVTGPWAEEQAEAVKAYADAGFEVWSRGYNRTAYSTLTATQIGTDLEKAEAAIVDAAGKSSKPYVRPPGDVSDGVLTALKAAGYCPILWTVDALDIQNNATVESSVARVTRALKNGAIILMAANSDLAIELAPAIATAVKDEGFTLVPLRDLLRVNSTSTNTNANANANTNSSVKSNSNTNRTTNSSD